MTHFTPGSAFAGGVLIGISAVLLLALDGRIAGVSGILGGLVDGERGDRAWRALFLVGLVLGTLASVVLTAGPPISLAAPAPALAVAGFLVGYGTRLGSGCTSGHGVCGMARLSVRSMVATPHLHGGGVSHRLRRTTRDRRMT